MCISPLVSLLCVCDAGQGEVTGWRKVFLYDRLMRNQSSTGRPRYYALKKHYEDSFSLK